MPVAPTYISGTTALRLENSREQASPKTLSYWSGTDPTPGPTSVSPPYLREGDTLLRQQRLAREDGVAHGYRRHHRLWHQRVTCQHHRPFHDGTACASLKLNMKVLDFVQIEREGRLVTKFSRSGTTGVADTACVPAGTGHVDPQADRCPRRRGPLQSRHWAS